MSFTDPDNPALQRCSGTPEAYEKLDGLSTCVETFNGVFWTKCQIIKTSTQELAFYKYPELPTELQLKIWEIALPGPRVLALQYNQDRTRGSDDYNAGYAIIHEGIHLRPYSPGTEQLHSNRLVCKLADQVFRENYSNLELDVFTPAESQYPILEGEWKSSPITGDGIAGIIQLEQFFDKKRDTLLLLDNENGEYDNDKATLSMVMENTVKFPGVANIAVCLDIWNCHPHNGEPAYKLFKDLASLGYLKSLKLIAAYDMPGDDIFNNVRFVEIGPESDPVLKIAHRRYDENIYDQYVSSPGYWIFCCYNDIKELAKRTRYAFEKLISEHEDAELWAPIQIQHCILANLVTKREEQHVISPEGESEDIVYRL